MGTPHFVHSDPPVAPPPFPHYYHPPPGAIHVDDWRPITPNHGDPMLPEIVQIVDGNEVKDGGKGEKKGEPEQKEELPPVDVKLEGWSLQKAPAESGRPSSWSRVIRRNLPYSQKRLANVVQAHKRSSRPAANFSSLSSSQQGVINRLIDEKALAEKHPHAQWVVVDVQKEGKWKSFTKLDINKIQVILKRIDQSPKPAPKGSASKAKPYQPEDLIDLAVPLPKEGDEKDKKDKDKKGDKEKQDDADDDADLHFTQWNQTFDSYGRPHRMDPMDLRWQYANPAPADPRYRTRGDAFERQHKVNSPVVHNEHEESSRRSNSKTKKRTRELEGRVEQLEDMIETMVVTERSDSPYDDRTRSSWSPTVPNISPASTPPPAGSPRGSRPRRRSSDDRRRRDSRYERRYHGERAEVQPAIGYRDGRDREREARYRHQERRITHYEDPHDDYPITRQKSRESGRDWDEPDAPLDMIFRSGQRRSRGYTDPRWHPRRWSLVEDPYDR